MSNFLRSFLRGQLAVIGTLLLAVLATSSVLTQDTMALVEQVETRILGVRKRVAKGTKKPKITKSSKGANGTKSTKGVKNTKFPKSVKKAKTPKGGKSTEARKSEKKTKAPKTSPPSTIAEREENFDTTNIEDIEFSGSKTKRGSPIDNAFDNDPATAVRFTKLPARVKVTYPAGLSFINKDYMLALSEEGPLPTGWTVEGLTSSGWEQLNKVTNYDWGTRREKYFRVLDKGATSSIRITFETATTDGIVTKKNSLSVVEISFYGLFATNSPTKSPTSSPTVSPTASPTATPTVSPTSSPTTTPTVSPTSSPTATPTVFPTTSPTVSPTSSPTVTPTVSPTSSPTATPTVSTTNVTVNTIEFRRNMLEESHTLLKKEVICESDETHHEYGIFNHFTAEYARHLLWPASIIANVFQHEDRVVGNKKFAMSLNDDSSYSPVIINLQITAANDQRQFLFVNGHKCYPSGDDHTVLKKFDMFVAENEGQFSTELWKYCALAIEGGAYIDSNSPLVESFVQTFSVGKKLELGPFGRVNYAVLGLNVQGTIHGSAIVLDSPMSPVALSMVAFLVETNVEVFKYSPLAVPKALYNFISIDLGKDPASLELKSGLNEGQISKWMMMNHYCDVYNEMTTKYMCPETMQFCCKIIDPCKGSAVMVTNAVLLPAYIG